MAKKYIDLTASQKDEIRRLTQFANRRIKSAQKVYAKEGMEVLPREVVGNYQIKEQWNTTKTPLSRSVKFESMSAYRKQLKMLQEFERSRPDIKEYTEIQREKTLDAVDTALGEDVPPSVTKKIQKLTAPQLSTFWNIFSDKSAKLGAKYASDSAMTQTLTEFFPEDREEIISVARLRPTPINYR